MDDQILSYVLHIAPVRSTAARIYLSITITLLQFAQHTMFWESLVGFDYLKPDEQVHLQAIHLMFTVLMIGWLVFSNLGALLSNRSLEFLILTPLILIISIHILLYKEPTTYARMMVLSLVRCCLSVFYKHAIEILAQFLISPSLKERYIFIMNAFSTLFAVLVVGFKGFFKVVQTKCHFTLCDYSECVLIGLLTGMSLLTIQIVKDENKDVYRFARLRYRLEPTFQMLSFESSSLVWLVSTCCYGIVHGYNFSCIEFSFLIDYFERYQDNIYPFLFWCIGTGICEFCITLFQSGNANIKIYIAEIIMMNAILSILQIFKNIPRYISYSILFRGAIMQYTKQEYYYMNQQYWLPRRQIQMYYFGMAIAQIVSIITFQVAWSYYYAQVLLEYTHNIYNANVVEMIFSGGLLVIESMAIVVLLRVQRQRNGAEISLTAQYNAQF